MSRENPANDDEQSTAAPEPARAATSERKRHLASRTTNWQMFVLVTIGVGIAVGVTIALVGYPSVHVASGVPNTPVAPHVRSEALSHPVPVSPPAPFIAAARVSKPVVRKPKPSPVRTTTTAPTTSVAPSRASAAAGGVAGPPVSNTAAAEPSTPSAAVADTAAESLAVTITGCLEMTVDEDQFRLADTEGSNAPKVRSWRSGFLKKRSAPVDLVGFSDAPLLRKYVGHRVAATGLLDGRELRLRWLQPAAESCE